ncbi:D-alanyl-D-alanine carboxypeptidase family protein [Coleofasciculus sp. H7-2]|uniref:M15 family metallopeptidase n=1 Tax=Coleofasciculus sp. H7-2 TaxID=3351545 RepID=UPI003672A603
MENAGMPGKPPKVSALPIDDIPEALRDTPHLRRRQRQWQPILLFGGLLGLGAIALIIGILLPRPVPESNASTPVQNEILGIQTPPATAEANTLFGHFPYQEAPQSELEAITADGRLKMRHTAARQYTAMVAAARASGIIIVPISGFRSTREQQHLYFDTKAQRGQSAAERAKVSAPPGHSEHHTGYAIDVGDGRVPATNLSPNFENTAAFKWLQKNAPYYSFEISFPRNNPQGVSYEPWHWRYVGDRDSLETFYKAKQFGKN